MTTKVSNQLLNPSLGILNVMDMPETDNLPRARDIATGLLHEAGMSELFAAHNAQSAIEELLVPDTGDGSILAPETFSLELAEIARKLSKESDPDLRALYERELVPLLQNRELLQAYQGLMIGG